MGYRGSREDGGRVIGGSGDNGLDGVIDQDALGLDRVYIQAKRYKLDNAVGEPEVRGLPTGAVLGTDFPVNERFCDTRRSAVSIAEIRHLSCHFFYVL
jgi:restriction endonuclease Mrr